MNPKADMLTLGARREVWDSVWARHRMKEGGRVLFGIPVTVGRSEGRDLVCLVSEIDDRAIKTLKKYAESEGSLMIYTWEKAELEAVVATWKNKKADVEVFQLKRTLH